MAMDPKIMQAYVEAQRGLVSTLLYIPKQLSRARTILSAEDFSDGNSRAIFEAMVQLEDENKTPTYANIVSQLTSTGKIIEAGGPETVERYFTDGSVDGMVSTVDTYCQTIKNVSSKNRISKIADRLHEESEKPESRSDDILSSGNKLFNDELVKLSNTSNSVSISDYFSDKEDGYLAHVNQRVKAYNEHQDELEAQQGVPSMFDKINKVTGGWQPGQLNVVGARTGIGKSFFLVDEAVAACASGASVLIFSLEMLSDEFIDRISSAYAYSIGDRSLPLYKLKRGRLDGDDLAYMNKMYEGGKDFLGISQFKLTIDSTPSVNLDHIRAVARQAKASENGLDLIIIDYLQLIQPPKGEMNRERQVAEISRGLKLLAMQLHVPIIVAVQLNRIHKGDEDPTPTINDIRESNAIAQDASVIVLIHRDVQKNSEGKYDPSTFIIGKNRNGRSGIRFKCVTQLDMASFREMEDDFGEDDDDIDDDSNEPGGNVQTIGDMGGAEETSRALSNAGNNEDDDDMVNDKELDDDTDW